MDDYFAILTDAERRVFLAITESAHQLGYRAKRDKTRSLSYTFTHRKVKKTLLRFATNRDKPILKIRFCATQQYSTFFHEAIRKTIEEYNFKYTGCYGCGNCDGTEGYWYQYPDGRKVFRCGTELIEIDDICSMPLEELLTLFKNQHDRYLADLQISRDDDKTV